MLEDSLKDLKYIKKIDKLINKSIGVDHLIAEIETMDETKLKNNLFNNAELLEKHQKMVNDIKNITDDKEVFAYLNNYLEEIAPILLQLNEKNNEKKKEIVELINNINIVLRSTSYEEMKKNYAEIVKPDDLIPITSLEEFETATIGFEKLDDPLEIYELKRMLVKSRNELESAYGINEKGLEVIKKVEKVEITKKDLVQLEIKEDDTPENKEKLQEVNKILDIFKTIAKPHIDSKSQPTMLSEKEIGILNVLKKNMGTEEFKNLKIKWNPFVGLYIDSKEGLNNDNQKLIMSHTDLVSTFQKSHEEVKDGSRESALTIGSDGLIRGSLDNTLTNAIVLNNIVNKKFENNVGFLFDRGEETGMWGASNFHDKKETDKWFEIELNTKTLKLSLNETEAPSFKKDLITVNTDVTMPSVSNPFTFEVRHFSKNTKNKMNELFSEAHISTYGNDDSASAVNNDMVAMSLCISTGTNVSYDKEGKVCFGGGCHSNNTATSIDNIYSYSMVFEPFMKAIGKEFQIEIEKPIYKSYNKYDFYGTSDILNDLGKLQDYEFDYSSIYNSYDDAPEMYDMSKDDIVFEFLRESLNKIDDGLEEVNGFYNLQLEEYEIQELTSILQTKIAGITEATIAKCDTKQDILTVLLKNVTDQELVEIEQYLYSDIEDQDEEFDMDNIQELIGDELYDFAYSVIIENSKYHTPENFDDMMTLQITSKEEVKILEKIQEKIEGVTSLNNVDTFNDLIELMAISINEKEIVHFTQEYEIQNVIEM